MAHLEDILQKLGWNSGFQMPIANVENQALEEELATLALRKIKAKTADANAHERLQALRDHFKFVTQENEQTQKLITAHKQQLEAEEHQLSTVKSEKSKAAQDIQQVNKRLKYLQERYVIYRNDLQRAVTKVEKLKAETGWDIEALQAWEESIKKREDDNELIKKFSKEDELKFNELEARRVLLQMEFDTKTEAVNKIVNEIQGDEMVIERTGKTITKLTKERESLINQWKSTVQMLHQRDEDISKAQDLIMTSGQILEEKLEKLDEEKGYWEIEVKNNKELNLELEELNARNSRLRRDLGELIQQILTLNGELQALRREVTAEANALNNERIKGKRLSKDIHEKEHLCARYREEIDKLKRKLDEMKGSNMSSTERLNKLQKLIDTETKQRDLYLEDTKKLNKAMYREEQVLKEHRALGKRLELEIDNIFCICNKLKKHIADQQKSLEKLKWVVYDMEYKIDEFEQKLCKLEGTTQEEHIDEKEEKIRELERVLSDHSDVQHALQCQVDRLQDEMRKLFNFISADKEQMEILQDKIENHLLVFDIGSKQILAAQKSNQEKQVEENMTRLRIDHIEKDMGKENERIFSLEKLRLSLDEAMKSRQLEIDTIKSILQVKRRALIEDRGRLRGDITLRSLKIEQLKKKYHIEVMALGQDEDGQPFSVTYFKIKNAQEKFMLQQQGDELDSKIKKAEKEIVAMENTLKVVNLTNSAFKSNLSSVPENDKTVQELNALEEQLRHTVLNLKRHKEDFAKMQTELEDYRQKLKEVENTRDITKEKINNLQEECEAIRKQEYNKQEKFERAEVHLKRLMKKLRDKDVSRYIQDLETRHLREVNKTVLKKFVSIVENYPEVAPLIYRYTIEHNVDLPSRTTPSTASYYSSSSASTTSSESFRSVPNSSSVNINKVEIAFNL